MPVRCFSMSTLEVSIFLVCVDIYVCGIGFVDTVGAKKSSMVRGISEALDDNGSRLMETAISFLQKDRSRKSFF